MSWDETWLAVAATVAKRAACVRAQVGAVIVSPTNRIIATGYNGQPAPYGTLRGGDCSDTCLRNRAAAKDAWYNDCIAIHAEANALLFCDRRQREGATLYVTSAVCYNCAKLVANSGISRVVIRESVADVSHRTPQQSVLLLNKCGIRVEDV